MTMRTLTAAASVPPGTAGPPAPRARPLGTVRARTWPPPGGWDRAHPCRHSRAGPTRVTGAGRTRTPARFPDRAELRTRPQRPGRACQQPDSPRLCRSRVPVLTCPAQMTRSCSSPSRRMTWSWPRPCAGSARHGPPASPER